MPDGEKVEIKPAKGRPMLTWVGKRPLRHVTAFPAQHIETFDPASDAANRGGETWNDWPLGYPRGGLLFHGDNKEVLAHLLANGFRGKVKLVYIDPPFDSGADYVRRVTLRGVSGTAKLDGESYALGEQIQYTDIWANDNYLQFMYERLMLIKELLAPDSNMVLHTDYHKTHLLRCLMDEVFGAEAFVNELVWHYPDNFQGNVKGFASNHDLLLWYGLGDYYWDKPQRELEKLVRRPTRMWDKTTGTLKLDRDEQGRPLYKDYTHASFDDVLEIPQRSVVVPGNIDYTGYPTAKPPNLLSLLVNSLLPLGGLVLDCFIGSGTSAAVAQKLGRRWVGCDINKGAVQTTSKRLQAIILEQIEAERKQTRQGKLVEGQASDTLALAQLSFAVYRVNDYDLQIQHNEAVNLACEHIGVTRTRSDPYFDGSLGQRLVKIVQFNHPLTLLDLEELKRELAARPEEERDVVVVCLGKETAVEGWLEEWNRLRRQGDVPNKIEVIELRTDPKYGKFFVHQPARAKVDIRREDGKIVVEIKDFISPTIIERLQQQAGLLAPKIDDWRTMVDCVTIDTAYDGQVFNIALSDVPARKNDLVVGVYELPASEAPTTVAVKIVDMLGEEVLVMAVV